METLPFKIVQSDGGDLKVLATVADGVMAQSIYNAIVEDMFDQKGSQPSIWMEEWVDGRWVISRRIEIDEQRKFYLQLMDETREISPDDRLLWRRLTDNEQDVIIRALERYTEKLEAQMHMTTRGTYIQLVNQQSFNYNETAEKMKKAIFDPWDRIRHIQNLTAYLRRNPIIVESEIILPEQL